jgi:hypothetical protein
MEAICFSETSDPVWTTQHDKTRKTLLFIVTTERERISNVKWNKFTEWWILSRFILTIDGVLYWRPVLLTASTHDSWLHLIIAPPLISNCANHSSTRQVFSIRCLVSSNSLLTASNTGDSSASALTSLLSGEYPTTRLIAPTKSSLHGFPYNSLTSDQLRVSLLLLV